MFGGLKGHRPALGRNQRIYLTMKSTKDMKKAVAGFRTSYIIVLAEVYVQPVGLATSLFGRRPNLFRFFMLFTVNYLFFVCTNH